MTSGSRSEKLESETRKEGKLMKDGFGDSYQYGEWGSVAEDSIKGHFEDASEIFHPKTRGWSICQSFLIPRCCSVVPKGIEVLGYLCSS